jgi:soluble lytic murein transglycosylase-like protein
MRRVAAVVAISLLAAACVSSEAAPREGGAPATAATTGATGATGSTGGAPEPDARIPRKPSRLADALEATWSANRDAISAWTTSGGSATWPVPEDVELLTLYEQRIYRTLAAHPALATRVVGDLSRPLATEAKITANAGHALYEQVAPLKHVPDFRVRRPEPADALLSYLREAEDRFGVAWQVLAAVMLVETRMGRVRSNSSAGAQGPMQFLPSTWDAYGLGGDIHDAHDAILGAANYLDQSGAPEDYRAALYHYNPLDAYVTAVWSYAKVMMHDPNAYYAFYNWQVFVRTTHGDVRLSGPGLPV